MMEKDLKQEGTVIRSSEEIQIELDKVRKARIAAAKKLERCDKRLLELADEQRLLN